MHIWKGAAVTAALLGAASAGAAFLPAAHAQTAAVRAPRALEILGGRGSQIGVTVRDLEDADAKTSKLPSISGVLIEDVVEDSPAAKAGLKKGDVVVEFDGERVRSVRQFTRLVQETPAGRRIQTGVMRDGQRVAVTVEPRENGALNIYADGNDVSVLRDFARGFPFDMPRPAVPPTPPATPKAPVPPGFPDIETFIWRPNSSLGITVGDLSAQLAEYFGTKDGVLVTSVADDSAASKAGIRAGDVITSFNGTDVTTPSDLRRRIQRLENGDEFSVAVMRDKKSLTLKGKADSGRAHRTARATV
jgi:serine protease Do